MSYNTVVRVSIQETFFTFRTGTRNIGRVYGVPFPEEGEGASEWKQVACGERVGTVLTTLAMAEHLGLHVPPILYTLSALADKELDELKQFEPEQWAEIARHAFTIEMCLVN